MTNDQARKRKRWRFGLSTLFIVVVLAGLFFSYWFNRSPLSLENLPELRQRARIDVDAWKIVWNDRGDRVAIVGWEKPVQIYDATTLWKTRTIGEGKKIIHFAFSPDPDVMAYCENQGQPHILNLATGKTLVVDTDIGQNKMSFSPDGKILASGKYGTSAFLWDVDSGDLIHELDVGPTSGGLRPLFSPTAASLQWDTEIRQRDFSMPAQENCCWNCPRRCRMNSGFIPHCRSSLFPTSMVAFDFGTISRVSYFGKFKPQLKRSTRSTGHLTERYWPPQGSRVISTYGMART